VIKLNGKRILLDIKTGNYVGKEAWLQLSAYRAIDFVNGHEPYDGIAILHLAAKTKTEGKKDSVPGQRLAAAAGDGSKSNGRATMIFFATLKNYG
jgi:hypothetical protein